MKSTLRIWIVRLALLTPISGLCLHTVGNARAQDSLSIGDAVALALKNAPQIRRGMALTDAAHARTEQISANNKPQLEAQATYTRIDPVPTITLPFGGKDQTFGFAPNDNYNAEAILQQMIWDFGKSSSQIAASEASEKSTKDNIEGIRINVALQVVQYYYGILIADETLSIEEQQKTILHGNLDITKQRETQGTATTLDGLNVDTRIASIESQEADIHASLEKQRAGLRRLLGMAPGTPILVKKFPADQSYSGSLTELLATAKSKRTELLLSHDAEEAARLQVESARHSSAPSLAANIAAGVKDGYFPVLTKPFLNWAGTVQFTVPILEGGRTEEKVAEAEANYEAAQAATTDTWQEIQSEVESAQADVDASKSKLGLTRIQIDQAQKALSVADARYKNGAATNLDYLTAQSQLEQAELQEAQTKFNYSLSIYNLKKAVGDLSW